MPSGPKHEWRSDREHPVHALVRRRTCVQWVAYSHGIANQRWYSASAESTMLYPPPRALVRVYLTLASRKSRTVAAESNVREVPGGVLPRSSPPSSSSSSISSPKTNASASEPLGGRPRCLRYARSAAHLSIPATSGASRCVRPSHTRQFSISVQTRYTSVPTIAARQVSCLATRVTFLFTLLLSSD